MEKKLTRSKDKMITGVCAGIAEYYGLNPTLFRLGYVALSLFTAAFPGLILYIVAMLIIPKAQ